MTRASSRRCAVVALALGATIAESTTAAAQARDTTGPKPKSPTHFFDVEDPLPLTLTANFSRLGRDKGEKVPWRAATVSYPGPDGKPITVPVTVRTRGFFRLKECAFPPLWLNFGRKAAAGTVFQGLDKPKLVNYCRDNDRYEEYVLQELQLYRIHALLTPFSHKTRLVRTTYVDSTSGKVQTTRYAFILEEPKALAERVGGAVVEEKGAGAGDFEPYHAALVGVFQYFIGNPDWSAAHLHNAEIVRDSIFRNILVPYDFDFAGAVNTLYAVPDSLLPIKSVRQRIFRGHCAPANDYARVFALFNEKKSAIYALYSDQIGRLLRPGTVKETLAYFDGFYRTIDSPRTAKREIVDACLDIQ